MFDLLPKSKQEAKIVGSKQYFTGKICKNGHLDKRYTNTGFCYSCKNMYMNKDYYLYKERVRKVNKKSYIKNRVNYLRSSQKWAEKNREKSNQIKQKSRMKHKEKVDLYNRNYMKKKRLDPYFRLSKNISKALWAWLNGLKSFRHWEDILGYTVEEVKIHLERSFRDGMSWDNYGPKWHIDHIKPLSKCTSLEEAWALTNLQPLLAKENLSKGNKYEEKY